VDAPFGVVETWPGAARAGIIMIGACHQLLQIEKSFRMAKSDLQAQPGLPPAADPSPEDCAMPSMRSTMPADLCTNLAQLGSHSAPPRSPSICTRYNISGAYDNSQIPDEWQTGRPGPG
jgi:hypothetical protein